MDIQLKLNLEQVNVILAAIGKLPFETVAPIVESIHQQAQPQLQAAEQAQNEEAQE